MVNKKYVIKDGIKVSLTDDINGVVFNKYSSKYMVNIELKNKTKALGITDTLDEGVELYLKACKKYKTSKVTKVYEQKSLF